MMRPVWGDLVLACLIVVTCLTVYNATLTPSLSYESPVFDPDVFLIPTSLLRSSARSHTYRLDFQRILQLGLDSPLAGGCIIG